MRVYSEAFFPTATKEVIGFADLITSGCFRKDSLSAHTSPFEFLISKTPVSTNSLRVEAGITKVPSGPKHYSITSLRTSGPPSILPMALIEAWQRISSPDLIRLDNVFFNSIRDIISIWFKKIKGAKFWISE